MDIKETISSKLAPYLTVSYIDIKDTTGKHIHHDNFDGGYHLNAIIVSDNFIDLELIERHQLVYKALASMIKNEIHALSMKTYTQDEWKEQFLMEIETENIIELYQNQEYRLIGMPFYNKANREAIFNQKLNSIVD